TGFVSGAGVVQPPSKSITASAPRKDAWSERRDMAGGQETYLVTVTATVLSPALLRKNSEPVPGLPPWTGIVTLVWFAGTITSGMMTLSLMSVWTSMSMPPAGAGWGMVKVSACCSPERSTMAP